MFDLKGFRVSVPIIWLLLLGTCRVRCEGLRSGSVGFLTKDRDGYADSSHGS